MAPIHRELLTEVLRACFEAAPEPLYPGTFAAAQGLDRAALDRTLDELRLKGLVRLTEWVQGLGQGYTLTQAGLDALENPNGVSAGLPRTAARLPVEEPYADVEARPRVPLIQPGRPIVTWTLIGLNVAYFLIGMFITSQAGLPVNDYLKDEQKHSRVRDGKIRGAGDVIELQGSLSADDVLQRGQWWRIIASTFIHLGVFHIGMNMYALYVLGPLLEAMWGSWRMLLVYLIAGVTGSCVVIWADRAAVGASGAISGLLGSLAVWVMLNHEHLPPAMAAGLKRMVSINLVLMLIVSFAIPNVSWQGHLGGAIGGALASFPIQLSRHGETRARRTLGLLAAFLVPIFFLVLAYSRLWGIRPPV
jgi:membrane associated rhomboid family serine protease